MAEPRNVTTSVRIKKKISTKIDKNGNIISKEIDDPDNMEDKKEARAKRLGLK